MSPDDLNAAPVNDGASALQLPARVRDTLPGKLPLIPLPMRPFFPAQSMPLVLPEGLWRETVERVGNTPHHMVGLVYANTEGRELPSIADFRRMGTVVRMHHPARNDGHIQFVAEGLQRFRIIDWASDKAPFVAHVEYPDPPQENAQELRAYGLAIIDKIKELLALNPFYRENVKAYLERFSPDDSSPLADFAAALTNSTGEEMQEIIDTVPLLRRMEKVMVLLQREAELMRLQVQIREKVEQRVSENQRDFFLREQLKEIQQQLGISKNDKDIELERFRERLADCVVPPDVQARINDEIEKFSMLETGSPEYAGSRNYLDTLTSLPWGKYTPDKIDIPAARKLLDVDHEGLADVKERIIEFLGVGALTGKVAGSIVLLVGPPGVGKTSIGRSIAAALGRKFYRFSVGGMRDEAEIKGHRRTYIGAMPGKFAQAMREVQSANPVIMLDEIDKIGGSYHGDPASALLEVLDPEQNSGFLDHYLDVRFDLSRVLFVCTANQLDSIPRPLLDRMEVIRLAGYVTEEKIEIAKKHLVPRVRERAGLKTSQLSFPDPTLRSLIDGYARESGVRNLEKQLNRIARKVALRVLEKPGTRERVTPAGLVDLLGQPLFRRESPQRGIGVVTGLAWTAMGGATLEVEASLVHTKNRGFRLTGQLGEVMRESAEIAYSYVAANLGEYQGDPRFFDEAQVHLHVPEGATPKDGPSAGITMATALLSLARNEPLARPIAMTGELTLTGRVLPVGGIREKLIAVRRIGYRDVILPEANRRDFEELPDYITKGMNVSFVGHFREVVTRAFKPRRLVTPVRPGEGPAARKKR